jgi:hypothetical protein
MTLKTTTCDAQPRTFLSLIGRLGLAAFLACDFIERPRPSSDHSLPSSVLKVETSLHRRLVENSIAVTSVSQRGVIFGLNDSGNGPYLFAFDSTGADRGVWHIEGAQNRDWEAAASGPCPTGGGVSCLYVGDVGDNEARKPRLTLYRFAEPSVSPSPIDSVLPLRDVRRLDFRYPDQPHDVEAMYVSRAGSAFLITKRRLLDAERRPRPALVFRIPATGWDSSGVVTAMLVDSLPIIPGNAPGRLVSDAALSPDGRLLAVRTYAEVYVFAMDTATALPVPGIAPGKCFIAGLRERQGEGIAWWWDRRRLVLTSEGRNAPLHVVECPLPQS